MFLLVNYKDFFRMDVRDGGENWSGREAPLLATNVTFYCNRDFKCVLFVTICNAIGAFVMKQLPQNACENINSILLI